MKNNASKEGRVNIPLGSKKTLLTRHAKKIGATETGLGRILLLDGLGRLESGEFTIQGPSLAPAVKEGGPAK